MSVSGSGISITFSSMLFYDFQVYSIKYNFTFVVKKQRLCNGKAKSVLLAVEISCPDAKKFLCKNHSYLLLVARSFSFAVLGDKENAVVCHRWWRHFPVGYNGEWINTGNIQPAVGSRNSHQSVAARWCQWLGWSLPGLWRASWLCLALIIPVGLSDSSCSFPLAPDFRACVSVVLGLHSRACLSLCILQLVCHFTLSCLSSWFWDTLEGKTWFTS